VIHLYAFARNLRGLPAQAGIGGRPLESLAVDGSTAIVSRVPTADGEVAQEAVVRHGLVVEAVLDRCDGIVPVRFGERFADEAALRAATARLRPSLDTRLRRLDGCVEIAVRVVDSRAVDPPSATDGTGYMAAKLGELRERDAVVEALHQPLEHEARASIVAAPRVGNLVHEGAYLVRRTGLRRFQDRVDRYAGEHPELTVVCTGPWAPYSFAAGVEEAA
jgi:gas vesicle protein GvpL/GvpF